MYQKTRGGIGLLGKSVFVLPVFAMNSPTWFISVSRLENRKGLLALALNSSSTFKSQMSQSVLRLTVKQIIQQIS